MLSTINKVSFCAYDLGNIYNAWKLEHDAEEFELQEMQGIVSITTSVLRICNVHTSVVKKLNRVCV